MCHSSQGQHSSARHPVATGHPAAQRGHSRGKEQGPVCCCHTSLALKNKILSSVFLQVIPGAAAFSGRVPRAGRTPADTEIPSAAGQTAVGPGAGLGTRWRFYLSFTLSASNTPCVLPAAVFHGKFSSVNFGQGSPLFLGALKTPGEVLDYILLGQGGICSKGRNINGDKNK